MHKIRNLTNSPYDIRLTKGKKVRLPARGEVGPVEIDPFHLPLYRALAYFEFTEVNSKDKEPKKAEQKQPQSPAPEPAQETTKGDQDQVKQPWEI